MNMHLRQCFIGVKPFQLKKPDLSGKPSTLKKARISKSGFIKAKLATLSPRGEFSLLGYFKLEPFWKVCDD